MKPSLQGQCEEITDAQHEALQPYRNLKDADLQAREGLFIAEGPETIKMLLRSSLDIASLLLKPSIYEKIAEDIDKRAQRPRVLVCNARLMAKVVGYTISRGALACGVQPQQPEIAAVLPPARKHWRVVAIDCTGDTANMGSILRTSSALGADCVLLSGDCCSQWYRRAVRVSMGHVFKVPVIRCPDLGEALKQLHKEHGLISYAGVIDFEAPLVNSIKQAPNRWCVVVGNEDRGISEEVRGACKSTGGGLLRIKMAPGCDSLSITVAAGVLIYGLMAASAGAES